MDRRGIRTTTAPRSCCFFLTHASSRSPRALRAQGARRPPPWRGWTAALVALQRGSRAAEVDGARKDILEAISHGPRGDIVSVYTTFPWPVLCAEVGKLNIEPAGSAFRAALRKKLQKKERPQRDSNSNPVNHENIIGARPYAVS
jgi:hypothetical protein